MEWGEIDTWMVTTAALISMACVLPGVFLLLSRQSMLAHGIAHSVLPGIVIGHLLSGGVETSVLLAGAVVAGVFCALLTRFLQSFSRVEEGAALGIAFTTLFAIGLVMQRLLADHVHIEADHVLFGNLEVAIFDVIMEGSRFPEAAQRGLLVLVINIVCVVCLFKELTISTFDPQFGDTIGARPRLVYYLLMAMSAFTCVIAFEAVGSILVVAMMIIPPAIGALFTRDLKTLVLLSLAIALGSAVLGHLLSLGLLGNSVGSLIGFEKKVGSTNTAGGIAVVLGFGFLISVIIQKITRKRASVPEVIPTASTVD